MKYQTQMLTSDVKLKVGDEITDRDSRMQCTIQKISDDTIKISDVSYSHVYDLTVFALKLFKSLKRTTGIKKINLVTKRGSFYVDEKSSERDLYTSFVSVQ